MARWKAISMRQSCVAWSPTSGLPWEASLGKRARAISTRKLVAYNNAARHGLWLVLRDLDHDAPCAAALVHGLLPEPARQMCFRIAVREVEAWLLADRPGIAALLQLPIDRVPPEPETLQDAKAELVALAHRSPNRLLRLEMVPAPQTTAKVGPGYTGRMIEFVAGPWRPRVAALCSPSLASCLRSLERWNPGSATRPGEST
jgi:hypothetical protein